MFIHGNKTFGDMSIKTKVDPENITYAMHEKMFYKWELINMVFGNNSMEKTNSNTEFKGKQIYMESLLSKFRRKVTGISMVQHEEDVCTLYTYY